MTTYEFFLFGHLLFVAVWIGTDVSLQLFYVRARMAGPAQVVRFSADVEWIGLRLLNPASLLVLLFGIGLLLNVEAFEVGQTWVWLGLLAFLASALTGAGFLGPETGRIRALAEREGPESPELQARIARVLTISRIELVILVLIILDMVVKPGFP